jgi:hypothetical protein
MCFSMYKIILTHLFDVIVFKSFFLFSSAIILYLICSVPVGVHLPILKIQKGVVVTVYDRNPVRDGYCLDSRPVPLDRAT